MCIRSRAEAAPVARGVYKPRRPHASPLFRLVQDHLHRLQTVYDERFARDYGPWRPVVAEVADTFLACGILEHGFAHIRCDDCAHEYLLAFSCKGRYFCPSCHAKRLAIWTQWLDTTLRAPVPHRQVVLTIPKRLRPYCLYRRRLLGEIARVVHTTQIQFLPGRRGSAPLGGRRDDGAASRTGSDGELRGPVTYGGAIATPTCAPYGRFVLKRRWVPTRLSAAAARSTPPTPGRYRAPGTGRLESAPRRARVSSAPRDRAP